MTANTACSRCIKSEGYFCEQKVAKKLHYSGPCWFHRYRPGVAKVFAPLFSKSGSFLRLFGAFLAPVPGASINAA
jgi:hypothetical protein